MLSSQKDPTVETLIGQGLYEDAAEVPSCSERKLNSEKTSSSVVVLTPEEVDGRRKFDPEIGRAHV